ncbi:MAG: hypothetical protein FWH20_02730 [Oscillospiraceae bacterium]|nr:hypothetical protein [Oscillospiraceae bacterium]
MNCFYHETKAAVSQCRNNCGKYLCADCYNQTGGSCLDCVQEYIQHEKNEIEWAIQKDKQTAKQTAKRDIKYFIFGAVFGIIFGIVGVFYIPNDLSPFFYYPLMVIIPIFSCYYCGSYLITALWLLRKWKIEAMIKKFFSVPLIMTLFLWGIYLMIIMFVISIPLGIASWICPFTGLPLLIKLIKIVRQKD